MRHARPSPVSMDDVEPTQAASQQPERSELTDLKGVSGVVPAFLDPLEEQGATHEQSFDEPTIEVSLPEELVARGDLAEQDLDDPTLQDINIGGGSSPARKP